LRAQRGAPYDWLANGGAARNAPAAVYRVFAS